MYKLEYTKKFQKSLKKIDKFEAKQIMLWLDEYLQNTQNPRLKGKGLTGDKAGLWRYRIGNYRVICDIQDEKLIIIALDIGHRRAIYQR